MMLDENEWLTIKQAAIVQGCSERKMYELVRQLPVGLIGTFYSSLPIRDLNALGNNREYRLHRSLFRAQAHALSAERLPEKAPKAKGQSNQVIDQGFAAWFREYGNGQG